MLLLMVSYAQTLRSCNIPVEYLSRDVRFGTLRCTGHSFVIAEDGLLTHTRTYICLSTYMGVCGKLKVKTRKKWAQKKQRNVEAKRSVWKPDRE